MKTIDRIDPLRDLGNLLLNVEKPARYVGGEYGSVYKESPHFSIGIAFPDLYEIGMSNQALRILYNGLNRLEGVACERVFAPAPDFEDTLKHSGLPLFTLESGIPLFSLDLLGITLGYELGITGALAILNAGGIPIEAKSRDRTHPIVLMGGPAATNPAPFTDFVDAVWLGEAEAGFFDLVAALRDLKRRGADRSDLLKRISLDSAVWIPGKKARRAVFSKFTENAGANVFPVSNIRVVQDHGSVEIMRGCPNGCRFCHAGIWYRPMRQKSERQICSEVDEYVRRGGYREITLSSLSSGDFVGVEHLVSILNDTYRERRISFQLPSLKISTFSLSLLEQLAEVRKSGLTFAVETPVEAWQMAVNKDVCRENVISILREAKIKGWRSAKFYFMIGLPVEDALHRSEEEEIVDFLIDVSRKSNMQINVNIGTFVPKPHTPYQWAPQLSENEADQKLLYIRNMLKHGNFKIGTHDPLVSTIEGVISRGDERVGKLLSSAFESGCRLDAWNEYIKKDVWKNLLTTESEIANEALRGRDVTARLPWDEVDAGVGKGFLKREYQRSQLQKTTSSCEENCTSPCGVCSDVNRIVQNFIHSNNSDSVKHDSTTPIIVEKHSASRPSRGNGCYQTVFAFTKKGPAIFVPHLGVIEVFSKAFVRSSLSIMYTEGFNPLPKINFAAPLSLGIIADSEIAVVETLGPLEEPDFIDRMNAALPTGFSITNAFSFMIPEGTKKVSAASILWGFTYILADGREVLVSAGEEKTFRNANVQNAKAIDRFFHRKDVLARDEARNSCRSYFEAYREMYSA